MKGRAWLELARISNLATCLSNVLVGSALGAGSGALPAGRVAAVTAAVMLLYVAGMTLNDVFDRVIDAAQRPGRPIPSGRVSARAATLLAVVCMVLALAILGAAGGWAALGLGLVLAAVIVVYDLLHKRFAVSAALMGVCRGLVYLVAAAAISWPPGSGWPDTGVLAGALAAYTTLLTVVAQAETRGGLGVRRWLAPVMPLVALAPLSVIQPDGCGASAAWGASGGWAWAAVALAAMLAWLVNAARHALARPPRARHAIHAWLSGMCLLDAAWLTLLDRPAAAAVAAVCFVVTVAGHRRILGT